MPRKRDVTVAGVSFSDNPVDRVDTGSFNAMDALSRAPSGSGKADAEPFAINIQNINTAIASVEGGQGSVTNAVTTKKQKKTEY